jgi:hypothetical protein
MSDELNQTSHAVGVIVGKLEGVSEAISSLKSKVNDVYDKQTIMNGSVAKAHWRQDETKKVIDVIQQDLKVANDKIEEVVEFKKKMIWTTTGLTLGGGVTGGAVAKLLTWLVQ